MSNSPEIESILHRTREFVRERLSGEGTGHDWFHIERVCRSALAIAREEKADPVVVELAALLHDVGDWKFHGGDKHAAARIARDWLESLGAPKEIVDHVALIADTISFVGAGVATPMSTLEGRAVQDADRLDALGAIGIARAFAYGGSKGRPLYDPGVPPTPHDSFDAYKKNAGPTINHFYEKLLLLKDRMQTDAGRRLAEERHAFLEEFLDQFFAEWNGKR